MSSKRNELCPCGSGKKFKHCCISKENASSFSNNKYIKYLINLTVCILILFAGYSIVNWFLTDTPEWEQYKCNNPACGQLHWRQVPATQNSN